MPRLKAAITINIHLHETGERHKVELIRRPCPGGRWWLRYNRRNSRRLPSVTSTEICSRIRGLISAARD